MILVSLCLLGCNCKYNGGNNHNEALIKYLKQNDISFLPLCPEQLGGLTTPRPCAELQKDNRILTCDGKDVTEQFASGAEKTLEMVKQFQIKKAILKSKSPSCGFQKVYDGSFSGTLSKGDGATTKLLLEEKVQIADENHWQELFPDDAEL